MGNLYGKLSPAAKFPSRFFPSEPNQTSILHMSKYASLLYLMQFLLKNFAPYSCYISFHKACPVDFEHQNYTIITSQCKGPQFPANICCTALKEFACPFAAELNDATSECSEIMFSYIRAYGNYPPGLFRNECRDTKKGLDCTGVNVPPASPSSRDSVGNNDQRCAAMSKLLVLVGCFLVLLFRL